MESKEIDVVVDVGANTGQYAAEIRNAGFEGRIVSLEPVNAAFDLLRRRAEADESWVCLQLALGAEERTVEINVSEDSQNSSFLQLSESQVSTIPGSTIVRQESAMMTTLDALLPDLVSPADRLFIKFDVQGYEEQALRGASATVGRTSVVEMELSLVEIYERQLLCWDAVDELDAAGFDLIWLETGFRDPRSAKVMQADGLFVRRESATDHVPATTASSDDSK